MISIKNGIFILQLLWFQGCIPADSKEKSSLPSYPVIAIAKTDLETFIHYPAQLEGVLSTAIRSKIQGYIKKVYFDEGDYIKKGQLLFLIESNILTQHVASAKASYTASNADIEAAEAQVKLAAAQLRVAQLQVDKLKPLVEKGIISDLELETAEANLAEAQANQLFIQANLHQIQAAAKSPTDIIPLTVISDISKIYAYYAMHEKEYLNFINLNPSSNTALSIKQMPEVELILSNAESYAYPGMVETETGQFDGQTGNIKFRAIFPNPEQQLKHGTSGTIRIPKLWKQVLVIPSSSSFERQGKHYVYLYEGDSVRLQMIELLEESAGFSMIAKGIQEGDQIVSEGLISLQNNMKINATLKAADTLGIRTIF